MSCPVDPMAATPDKQTAVGLHYLTGRFVMVLFHLHLQVEEEKSINLSMAYALHQDLYVVFC